MEIQKDQVSHCSHGFSSSDLHALHMENSLRFSEARAYGHNSGSSMVRWLHTLETKVPDAYYMTLEKLSVFCALVSSTWQFCKS